MSTVLIKIALSFALALALIQIFVSEEHHRRATLRAPHLSNNDDPSKRPNGVIVVKVQRAEHATRTVCTLNRFFGIRYPVRIFADYDYTNETLEALQHHFSGGDLQIIVDTESWKQLPPMLNETERQTVLDTCRNFEDAEMAMCSKYVAGLSYLYMGYWRYTRMADEPSLQQFEYFISIDADAYLTKPMDDPFQIMQDHGLTGIFSVQQQQVGLTQTGIQEAVDSVSTLQERQDKFLDEPKYSILNQDGKWHRSHQGAPSIWGYLFGGRLDFFRTPKYRQFARRIVPYTYTYRTDEQGVIAVAWSLFANNSKIWNLPQHGYQMGIYHQGFVDQSQVVKSEHAEPHHVPVDDNDAYVLNTLNQWSNFSFTPHLNLVSWYDYVNYQGYDDTDSWQTCVEVCTKHCNPWVDPRTLPSWNQSKV